MTKDSGSPTQAGPLKTNGFISAREVALRLGVSTRTIYRMPRGNGGPFKIHNLGRRVLINRIDFEQYLANRSESMIASDVPATTAVEDAPVITGESRPSHRDPNPSTGSGQRDLIIPIRRPFVVLYVA